MPFVEETLLQQETGDVKTEQQNLGDMKAEAAKAEMTDAESVQILHRIWAHLDGDQGRTGQSSVVRAPPRLEGSQDHRPEKSIFRRPRIFYATRTHSQLTQASIATAVPSISHRG